MKFKKLCFAALPIAATITTLPIIVSCQSNSTKTLTYYEAKEWVKNNIGTESKQYVITKTESNWSFGGFITNYGGESKDAAKRVGWLYGHLDNLIAGFADVAENATTRKTDIDNTAVDKAGAMGETGKGLCKLGDIAYTTQLERQINNFVVEGEDLSKVARTTLSANSFDDVLKDYFFGFYMHNADYIVDEKNKTITVHGTFSYIGKDTEGTHNIKLPNLKVTFNKEGKVINCAFKFDAIGTGTYMWQGDTTSDGYSFAILPGAFLNFNYTSQDAQ